IDVINSKGEHLFEIESFEQWLLENSFTPKPSVIKLDDLPTDAIKNEVRGVEETNKIYVYDGTEWIDFASLSFDELTLLNESLHDKINEVNAIKSVLDTKVDEVNTLIEDSNYWQKHKLTKDNGEAERLSGFDFDTEVDALSGSKFFYVTSSKNGPLGVSTSGFVEVLKRVDDSAGVPQFKVLYTPYNSEKVFMRLKYLEWRPWVEITNLSEDTGWIPFTLNAGIIDKVAFQASGENGYQSSYRTIKNGEEVKRLLRLNVDNITNNQVLGYLPQGFVLNSQTLYIRTKWSEVGIITVRPSGEVQFHRAESSRERSDE